jgi:eukaryotic-like serine/threonine-protein kinase
MLGTSRYRELLHPEYHRGHPLSPAVISYELLTGKLPFDREMSVATINRLNYISAKQYHPQLSHWVDTALAKGLMIEPRQSYQQLSELVFELSHPIPENLAADRAPLTGRDPVGFWRGVTLIMAVGNLIFLFN